MDLCKVLERLGSQTIWPLRLQQGQDLGFGLSAGRALARYIGVVKERMIWKQLQVITGQMECNIKMKRPSLSPDHKYAGRPTALFKVLAGEAFFNGVAVASSEFSVFSPQFLQLQGGGMRKLLQHSGERWRRIIWLHVGQHIWHCIKDPLLGSAAHCHADCSTPEGTLSSFIFHSGI